MMSSIVLVDFINACVGFSYIMENAFPQSPRLIEIKLVFISDIKLSDIMTTLNSALEDFHTVLSIRLIITFCMKMYMYLYINKYIELYLAK